MVFSKWMLLVRYGEIALKSAKSRARMELKLVNNIVDALKTNGIDHIDVSVSGARVWICCFTSEDEALKACEVVSRVMGVVSLSPVVEILFRGLEDLACKAVEFFRERVKDKVFAVRAHRVGRHDFTSKDVEKVVGKLLLDVGAKKVDLENPEYEAYIEIRGDKAYLFDKVIKGPGGLPIGSEGKVLSLFSGGIDSPVATWFAMKRGCEAHMVLFNIGGDQQVYSAMAVAKVLVDRWAYGYRPKFYVVDVRPFIAKIALRAPEELMVILLRRLMAKLGEMLARKIGALALVTGESIGQVASQTLHNLSVIEEATTIPILRPLIGLDKQEIVDLARKIGTYELSAKMIEYCPMGARRVTTRADLHRVKEVESKLGISQEDLERAIEDAEEYDLRSMSLEDIIRKIPLEEGICKS